jgi:SRSO17 transposase
VVKGLPGQIMCHSTPAKQKAMLKVSRIPQPAKKYFEEFKEVIGKRCLALFMFYVFGLIIAGKGKRTVSGVSRLYLAGKSRSNLSRLFTDYKWDCKEALLSSVERIMTRIPFKVGERIMLILDDTKMEKTGRKMDGIGKMKRNDGSFCIGHCKVSMTLVYNGISFPVDLRLYIPKAECERLGVEFKTKIQLGLEMIKSFQVPMGIRVVVLFDCWYLTRDVVQSVKERGFSYVSYLRSNRNIKVGGKKIRVDRYGLEQGYQKIGYIPRGLSAEPVCHQAIVDVPKVGVANLVISRTSERSLGLTYKYFVTDMSYEGVEDVLRLYDKRWEIECEYRSSKQDIGMGEYQMRDLTAIVRHLYAATISLLLLVYLSLETQKRTGRKFKNYADTSRWIQAVTMQNSLKWFSRQVKKGCNVNKIIDDFGGLCA